MTPDVAPSHLEISIAAGATVLPDRDPDYLAFTGGGAIEVDTRVAGPFRLRVDGTWFGWTWDALQIEGPVFSAMMIAGHQGRGWSFDVGVGPSVAVGTSNFWGWAYSGAFPGLRAAAGAEAQPYRAAGLRLEAGWAQTWGARALLNGTAGGPDFRLLLVVHPTGFSSGRRGEADRMGAAAPGLGVFDAPTRGSPIANRYARHGSALVVLGGVTGVVGVGMVVVGTLLHGEAGCGPGCLDDSWADYGLWAGGGIVQLAGGMMFVRGLYDRHHAHQLALSVSPVIDPAAPGLELKGSF